MFSSNAIPGRFKGLNFDVWELKQRRFWPKHINWKWGLLLVNIPWSYQFFVAKYLYSYWYELPEILGKIAAQQWKMATSGWRAWLKTSLPKLPVFCIRGGGASTLYKLCKLDGYVLLGFFIWLIFDGVPSFDLFLWEMGVWLQNINFPVLKRCVVFLYFQIRPL